MSIADNITTVRERIAAAARRAGRSPDEITLVAVTKTHTADTVGAALAAGVTDCGENRVQEAEDKIPLLPPHSARWHLIGHLQRNKVRRAVALFDLVHSVDSLRLAEALNRAVEEAGGPSARRLPVLLQVNVSGEPSKGGFGVPPGASEAMLDELDAAVERIAGLALLDVQGLMTVAPLVAEPEQARWVFSALRRVRDGLERRSTGARLHHLSMGMTDDFEVAIEEGATIVRIGRAIFGQRITNE